MGPVEDRANAIERYPHARPSSFGYLGPEGREEPLNIFPCDIRTFRFFKYLLQ